MREKLAFGFEYVEFSVILGDNQKKMKMVLMPKQHVK